MTIHIRSDQEQTIEAAMQAGLITNPEDALDAGLESLRNRLVQRPKGKKSLVELFAPLRGLDPDFSRNPSTGRPIDR